jgi:hypothetical protein
MVGKIIGALHLLVFSVCGFFFLFPKSNADFLFLTYVYVVHWIWTMFHGHCPVSYYYNKGKDTLKLNDILYLFGNNHKPFMGSVKNFLSMLNPVSIAIILYRNNMNVLLGIVPGLVYGGLIVKFHRFRLLHIIFWFVFPFFIYDSVRRYVASTQTPFPAIHTR